MPFPMPALKQVPSPNYTPTAIAHDLVIVHMMEGSYAGSVSWLCQKQANASAHLCLKADGFEVTQLVPLQHRAWAQCAFNGRGVSIECEGFTAKGFTDTTMTALARCTAAAGLRHSLPACAGRKGSRILFASRSRRGRRRTHRHLRRQ